MMTPSEPSRNQAVPQSDRSKNLTYKVIGIGILVLLIVLILGGLLVKEASKAFPIPGVQIVVFSPDASKNLSYDLNRRTRPFLNRQLRAAGYADDDVGDMTVEVHYNKVDEEAFEVGGLTAMMPTIQVTVKVMDASGTLIGSVSDVSESRHQERLESRTQSGMTKELSRIGHMRAMGKISTMTYPDP